MEGMRERALSEIKGQEETLGIVRDELRKI